MGSLGHLGIDRRWGFAEFTEVYQIETDFKAKVASEFNNMLDRFTGEKD